MTVFCCAKSRFLGLTLAGVVGLAFFATPGFAEVTPREFIRQAEQKRESSVQLLTYLQAQDDELRAAAARCLGRIRDKKALDALEVTLSSESSKLVRRWLLFALGQIEGGAEVLASWLSRAESFKQLMRPDDDDLAYGMKAFARCAKPNHHEPILVARLNHSAPKVRQYAALGIALCLRRQKKPLKAPIVNLIIDALIRRCAVETEPEATWALSYALASAAKLPFSQPHQIEAFQSSLNQFLSSKHSVSTRAFAARAVGQRAKLIIEQSDGKKLEAPASVCPRIDWPWEVAVEALRSLKYYSGPKVEAAYLECASKHSSFHVRRFAVRAIGERFKEFTDENKTKAVSILDSRLQDLWETVRGESLLALTKIQPDKSLNKIETFATGSMTARMFAARSLAVIKDRAKIEKLVNQLRLDKAVAVRLALLDAIVTRDDQLAQELSLAALDDVAISVCGTAVSYLAKDPSGTFIDRLQALYFNNLKNPAAYELRELIIKTMGDLLPKGTERQKTGLVSVLKTALTDPRMGIRELAADLLEKETGEKVEFDSVTPPAAPTFKPVKIKQPWVLIETSRGRMFVELFADVAPIHVANFCHLIQQAFYSKLTWHRVVSHFVVQGGCPNGDGWGDPGWTVIDELSDLEYRRGTLGMPKAGPDTGGCQLFFCHGPTPHLEGHYTIFGQIRYGLDVLDLLEEGDGLLNIQILSRSQVDALRARAGDTRAEAKR